MRAAGTGGSLPIKFQIGHIATGHSNAFLPVESGVRRAALRVSSSWTTATGMSGMTPPRISAGFANRATQGWAMQWRELAEVAEHGSSILEPIP